MGRFISIHFIEFIRNKQKKLNETNEMNLTQQM